MSDLEKSKKLETALEELNDIVREMEKPDLPLEESFELYSKGIKLVEFCNEKIDKVEKEIKIL